MPNNNPNNFHIESHSTHETEVTEKSFFNPFASLNEINSYVSTKLINIDEYSDLQTSLFSYPPFDKNVLIDLLNVYIKYNSSIEALEINKNYDDPRQLLRIISLLLFEIYYPRETEELIYLSTTVLKIICRKEINRKFIGEAIILNILKVLSNALSVRVALESSICILNLCYEKENVDILIACDGLPLLLNLLGADDETFELQTATLGALQSISFSKFGRTLLSKSLPIFSLFIDTKNLPMTSRALGVIHNLSTHFPNLIHFKIDVLEKILLCLSINHVEIQLFAIKIIQNVSREILCRNCILQSGNSPINILISLLFDDDVEISANSAAAILTLIGPNLPNEDFEDPERIQLRNLLSESIAMSAIYNSVFP